MTGAGRALKGVRAPDEPGAEERAWETVRALYLEQPRTARRRSHAHRAGAFAVGLAVVGAIALSPAGATVGRLVTRALGVRHAAPAPLSLPSPGRLLVSGPAGTWTIAGDGSATRLGSWRQASWSPHGRYLAVARGDQLAAVDPRGRIVWSLTRAHVGDPSWYPPNGYRIAYLSGRDVRVVAGDGSGDHLVAAGVAPVAPAWRPAHPYQLAYVTKEGRVVVRDTATGRVQFSVRPSTRADRLGWSVDGQRLLAISATAVDVYGPDGALVKSIAEPLDAPVLDAALSPRRQLLAMSLGGSAGGVVIDDVGVAHAGVRRVLAGTGLGQVVWSPDGTWLLASWPLADQWVFIRVAGSPRIAAISRVAQEFSGSRVPLLDGWCCSIERPAR